MRDIRVIFAIATIAFAAYTLYAIQPVLERLAARNAQIMEVNK